MSTSQLFCLCLACIALVCNGFMTRTLPISLICRGTARPRMTQGLSMIEEVSPQFAHKFVQEGFAYIDVRTEEECANGHPSGSVCVPAFWHTGMGMKANPDFVKQVEGKFPEKDTRLVIGCQMGSRSAAACEWLEESGYTTVFNVVGGYSSWARDESLPVER